MRPRMRSDCHPSIDHLLGDLRMPRGVFADFKERALEAIVGKRLENCRCVFRPRPVVKGQHDLLIVKKIVLLEVLKAESGATRRVDLDNAR